MPDIETLRRLGNAMGVRFHVIVGNEEAEQEAIVPVPGDIKLPSVNPHTIPTPSPHLLQAELTYQDLLGTVGTSR